MVYKKLRIPLRTRQPKLMTDRIGKLRTEPKPRTRQRRPFPDHRLRLQVIPKRIQLDAVELPDIMTQKSPWPHSPRIQLPPPFSLPPPPPADPAPQRLVPPPRRPKHPLRHHRVRGQRKINIVNLLPPAKFH